MFQIILTVVISVVIFVLIMLLILKRVVEIISNQMDIAEKLPALEIASALGESDDVVAK